MAKRDTLRLSPHQFIETSRDTNGRFWIAYSGGASVFVRDVKELRRFLKVPKGLPMRESLDSWLASLADMDASKKAPVVEAPVANSWDPAAEPDGPNKMVI